MNEIFLKKIPRVRMNDWGTCFFDCLFTLFGEDLYFESYGSLYIKFKSDNFNWNNIIFNENEFYNLNFFYGIKIKMVEKDRLYNVLNNMTKPVIAEISSMNWIKHKYYQMSNRSSDIHFLIIDRIDKNYFKIYDPYYEEIYILNALEVSQGLNNIFLIDSSNKKSPLNHEEKRFFIKNEIEILNKTFHRLYTTCSNLIVEKDTYDLLALYNVCLELANKFELFYLRILEAFNVKDLYNTNSFIRVILTWQYIRKTWIKNIEVDKISTDELFEIHTTVTNNISRMLTILSEMNDRINNGIDI